MPASVSRWVVPDVLPAAGFLTFRAACTRLPAATAELVDRVSHLTPSRAAVINRQLDPAYTAAATIYLLFPFGRSTDRTSYWTADELTLADLSAHGHFLRIRDGDIPVPRSARPALPVYPTYRRAIDAAFVVYRALHLKRRKARRGVRSPDQHHDHPRGRLQHRQDQRPADITHRIPHAWRVSVPFSSPGPQQVKALLVFVGIDFPAGEPFGQHLFRRHWPAGLLGRMRMSHTTDVVD